MKRNNSANNLRRYNPRVIELAERYAGGSLRALVLKIGVAPDKFWRWTLGDRLPDFEDKATAKRYRKADRALAKLAGLTLAEVFAPAAPPVQFVDLAEVGDQAGESPEDLLNARIDIARTLAGLPPDQRSILLELAAGATATEIAEKLKCSRQAVEQKAAKARASAWRRYRNGAPRLAS